MESYVEFVPAKMARGTIMTMQIMSNKELSNHAKVLFTVLSEYARDKHFCYPSFKTLMQRMNCSLNSLKKYIGELVRLRFLIIENRKFFLFCPKVSNFDKQVSNFDSKINIKNINILTPPTPSSEKVNLGRQKKTACSFEGDFNKFWDCYPRKENKQFAITQFIKLKKKQLLPPFEYFKKSVSFFMNSKQWNRENGRYIPCLSKFLANAKWEEVPMEVFEAKRELSHRNIAESVENATKQWERQKKEMVNNSETKATLEDIENAWHEFTGKFKPEFGYKQFVAKAKFIELCNSGFSFGVIEENKNITPAEFLQHMKNQKVR